MPLDFMTDEDCDLDYEDYDEDDSCDCRDCREARDELEFFEGFDNPEFVFHSLDETDGRVRFNDRALDDTVYLGIELEYTSECTAREQRLLERHGDLLWAKEDGSVEGFEMCVHPVTYAYAMQHFPFDLLAKLRQAGCSVDAEGNGLHVHVSRGGFDGKDHLKRWVHFLWDNADECRRIGGRDGSRWGNFDGYSRNYLTEWIDEGPGHGSRYLAVNLTNWHTVEVRFMASTTGAKTLRKRLQFVASSVEFARGLTGDLNRGARWETYLEWLAVNRETYPELAGSLTPAEVEAEAEPAFA